MAVALVARITALLLITLLGMVVGDVVVITPDGLEHTFSSMSARFGGDLPDKGLLMRLAAADPRWACGPVTPKDPALGPTALLIERGGPPNQPCAFAYKAMQAQRAGYNAAIIYDDEPGDLIPMSSDEPDDIVIPACFIHQQDGRALIDLLKQYNGNVTARLTPSAANDEWPSLMVTFTTIVASVIFLFTVFLVYRQRRYRARHGSVYRASYSRLTNLEISKLAGRKYGSCEPDDVTCVICLSEFETGDALLVLPCKHEFHKDCITPWLSGSSRTCPLCKRDAQKDPAPPTESTPINGASTTYDTYEAV